MSNLSTPKSKPALWIYVSVIVASLLGLCLCLIVVLSGLSLFTPGAISRRPTPVSATVILVATSIPTPTPTSVQPTITRTLQPTEATLTATESKLSFDERYALAQTDIDAVVSLLDNQQWSKAIPVLERLVQQLPEWADLYYQLARCYTQLGVSMQVQSNYRKYMETALAYINQAIERNPDNGAYYYERHAIYYNLGETELYLIDQRYWFDLALADIRSAQSHQAGLDYMDRDEALRLLDLGQCAEALALFQSMPVVPGATRETDPGLQSGLAEAYFCQGELETALIHVDRAIQAGPGWYKQRERAMILYSLGRYEQALTEMQAAMKRSNACGCGYFMRALLYYKLGQTDQALADIQAGDTRTWERGGVRSYVLAHIALDSGDKEQGIALLQEAEAAMQTEYVPLLRGLIRQELEALNAVPLDPTPYIRTTPVIP